MVRVFITDLVLLTGMHRFYNLLHKNRRKEGADYYNRVCIPVFFISGAALRTGVAAVTGVFPGTRWGYCQRRI